MSNEQTVREAIARWPNFSGDLRPVDLRMSGELASDALNLDPDRSVSELQRRLRIADRVLELDTEAQEMRRTDPEAALLAWLTRENVGEET
jgi:hypothetical protein